ncbi:MAG: hypothetical protein HYU73_25260 [Betaproteobacteria bacterium]|nr:hypothetical protein [Betaproteobacteria bacterium]
MVRKRTLPDAVESTVFDLAEFIRAKPVEAQPVLLAARRASALHEFHQCGE